MNLIYILSFVTEVVSLSIFCLKKKKLLIVLKEKRNVFRLIILRYFLNHWSWEKIRKNHSWKKKVQLHEFLPGISS